jgi:hypothetical protein
VYHDDLHVNEKQPDTSNQRVYRQGQIVKQADRGVHDYNMDKCSDSDETLLPHRTSGTMAWRQQTDATNTRIRQFPDEKPGKRQNVAPHINKDSTPDSVFMLYFATFFGCWWMRTTTTTDSTSTH